MRAVSRTVLLLLASLALAGTAWALPSGLLHVDPKAPCFRWPAVDMDGDGVYDRVDNCVSTPAGCIVDEHGCHSDADQDGVCDGVDQCPGTASGAEVDERGCVVVVGAKRTSSEPSRTSTPPPPASSAQSETERQLTEKGRIRLENVYFERNSARLLPESEASLDEAGKALAKYPDLEIEVEGHSDTRGSEESNRVLSQRRAEAVRTYLIEHHSLRPGNVKARGYGESRPETRERNEEEFTRNRRVEIRVLNPEVLPRGVKVENKD